MMTTMTKERKKTVRFLISVCALICICVFSSVREAKAETVTKKGCYLVRIGKQDRTAMPIPKATVSIKGNRLVITGKCLYYKNKAAEYQDYCIGLGSKTRSFKLTAKTQYYGRYGASSPMNRISKAEAKKVLKARKGKKHAGVRLWVKKGVVTEVRMG